MNFFEVGSKNIKFSFFLERVGSGGVGGSKKMIFFLGWSVKKKFGGGQKI